MSVCTIMCADLSRQMVVFPSAPASSPAGAARRDSENGHASVAEVATWSMLTPSLRRRASKNLLGLFILRAPPVEGGDAPLDGDRTEPDDDGRGMLRRTSATHRHAVSNR